VGSLTNRAQFEQKGQKLSNLLTIHLTNPIFQKALDNYLSNGLIVAKDATKKLNRAEQKSRLNKKLNS